MGRTVGPEPSQLAERRDLGGLLSRDDWNTLAIRARGPELWVYVNGAPTLYASDPTYDRGGVFIGLTRDGDPDDTAESAVVVRDLRVSPLAAWDPERAPRFGPP